MGVESHNDFPRVEISIARGVGEMVRVTGKQATTILYTEKTERKSRNGANVTFKGSRECPGGGRSNHCIHLVIACL